MSKDESPQSVPPKQLVPKPKIFGTLITEVIKKNLCIGCGACIASCPVSILYMKGEIPSMIGKCIICEYCYYQCPVPEFLAADIEKEIFGRVRSPTDEIGICLNSYSARAKHEEILKMASDGGVVTSLLAYALQKGIIDSAVISGVSEVEPWKPTPKVALTYTDLIESQGTRYTTSPTLVGLWSAVEEYDKKKIGVVGVPCAIKAIRKMQTATYGVAKLGGRVAFTIGLFCMDSFYYKGLIEDYLRQQKGIDLNKITKFTIRRGKFIVSVAGEEALNVPLAEVKSYSRDNCHSCADFTAEFADISVGAVGSLDGWSTVIVRTEVGKKLLEDAINAGYLECKSLEKPGAVIKLTQIKCQTATPVTIKAPE
ncbi:MAG: Coenzyme F420 hydrogenase/dehydrogenase, beta subunit C-terminal domain [Candidatus Bathyarchaeota archaeon]